jgi:hypothetical protein
VTFAANSAYEAWVSGLRAWGKDPNTDLGELPKLCADSFPPPTYERLVAHIMTAQQEVMSTWQQRLARNIQSARSEHDYARTLVELRSLLGRRLQLAKHPGLPDEVRRPLAEGVERDIRRLQEDLEKAVQRPDRAGGIQLVTRERMLRLVRANSFTALLKPGFPLESLFATPAVASDDLRVQPSVPPGGNSDGPKRITRRRVVLDGD